jgi:uncharacterized protein
MNTEIHMKTPKDIAIMLLKATTMTDDAVFFNINLPRYTSVDYYRIACHILFECKRCGTCCITGDPIRLDHKDVVQIAKYKKIPISKAIKKYTIPDPDKPGVMDFKHVRPCKFYDKEMKSCMIYSVRPWSCRIFPFLGIYDAEDKVKIHESCPGSLETARILSSALKEAYQNAIYCCPDKNEVKLAKEKLRAILDKI